MNSIESEKEESSDSELILTNETFDSLITNINQDHFLNQINNKIDNIRSSKTDFLPEILSDRLCDYIFCTDLFLLILCRIIDTFFFLILILGSILIIISAIALIIEVGISFYSVIMMNYVFFVSSIVSYTMAPIYQSLSKDWINFIFSFAQVILASPLISFYIIYILKSVINLASFISDMPSVIENICYIMLKGYVVKDYLNDYIVFFFNIGFVYDFSDMKSFLIYFAVSIGLFLITACIAYVEFCFDKTIIMFGSICYIINTIQIFILIFPSYIYFLQTLLNIKCKENKFVKKYINFLNSLFNKLYNPDSYWGQVNKFEYSRNLKNIYFDSEDSISNFQTPYIKRKSNCEDESENIEKMIDDSDISDISDEDKVSYKILYDLYASLLHLVTANNYFCLYHYSKTIAFDKHKKCRKIILMYIFFILNLIVISYDIYQLKNNYTGYFLASIIIRFLFIPLFSYYNVLSIFFYRSKNATLNIVLIVSSFYTIVIAFAIIIIYQFNNFYQNNFRINDLQYVPPLNNYTSANKIMIKHPICDYKIYNVSSFDAFGYSLGGYDVKRNITIFNNQMKTFFGENYSSHISYETKELDENFLFIKYKDTSINTNIFAFRGYNSGPEIAFQLEILAIHYVIPFFEDIVPFYESINDYWLSFYTDFLNSFGLHFFENNNLMVKYVNLIIDEYNKDNLNEDDQVLFAGINSGGVLAKIIGTLLHQKSISFISFPIDNDFFEIMFDFSTSYMSLVTNVYNVDGFFSGQEPRYATNIGIDIPIFHKTKFCTSGICEIDSKTDNVYRTFCTMSEICGKGNQFNYYCENIIGNEDLETIRESLKENN